MRLQTRLNGFNPLTLTLRERVRKHNLALPQWSKLYIYSGKVYGFWMDGTSGTEASKQGIKGFYGSYPLTYLRRVRALFPDCKDTLHLFSGHVKKKYSGEVTFDINSELKPDVCGDVRNLLSYFKPNSFDLILADPPYEDSDFEVYKQKPISKQKALCDCCELLKASGFLVWLDTRWISKMKCPEKLKLVGLIGFARVPNHRVRIICIYQKDDTNRL